MSVRKFAALTLVYCLLLTPLPGRAASTDPDGLKQRIDLLGAGARVKLKLADGKKLRGQLAAIEDDSILLTPNEGAAHRRIVYSEVAQIQPAKKDYRASGQPDPAEARRAVVGLGRGHHVMVRLAGDRVLRGHISAIESSQFQLLPDGGADALPIDYAAVHHIRKNPSTSTIVLIAVGAAIATVLVVVWAIRESNE